MSLAPDYPRAYPRQATSEAECLAARFHEAYERLAPGFGYATREASAVPWSEVPEPNRGLMLAVAADLLDQGVAVPEGWRR